MNIVLASASERRQELLKRIVKEFEIKVGNFNEDSVKYEGDLEEYVINIAIGKGKSILQEVNENSIVISADTIVVKGDKILGKPKDKKDARNMLNLLKGTSHWVYTAIVVVNTSNGKIEKQCIKTKVYFSDLLEEEINSYIETGEPLDKAGAYGIQGFGGVFVKGIEGCYYNVVGLPLNAVKELLDNVNK